MGRATGSYMSLSIMNPREAEAKFICHIAGLTLCCCTGSFLMQTCPLKLLSPDGASFLLTQLCPLVIQGCALMAALSSLTATGAHDMVSPVWWQSWCPYCSGGHDCVVSEVARLMWSKSAVEEIPTDTGISLGKGTGWSLNVQPRSWNMGQLWKFP